MESLVSVIVPIYNIEQYLERCVDSIVKQTYKNLEIVLVDDGSTDKSGQLCDMYASQDSRIKVIHKKNGGLSEARNAAIEVVKGELLTFVDGDDFLTSTAIESMVRTKEKTGAQIVCCLYKLVYEGHPLTFDEAYTEDKISVYTRIEALEKMLRRSEFGDSACAKLYNRELFKDVRYPNGELFEDIGTTYKLFATSKTVALVRIDGYGYFVRSGSIQQSGFSKAKMAELRFAKEQKQYLDARFSELENATTDRLVSSCFHILFSVIGQEQFEAVQKEVEKIIRDNRKMLVLAKKTSKKTRYGCLLSYLGFSAEVCIYRILGIRGKMMS